MLSENKLTKISARNILIDVDDTITGCKKGIVEPVKNCIVNVLVSIVAQKYNIDLKEAERRIQNSHDSSNECISTVLPGFGIDKKEYWDCAVGCLRKYIYVYPDAAAMIKRLYQSGFSLYPATTNSAFTITAKLATGDLASCMHVPYYKAVLGGCEVHPEGKSSPEFYKALMGKFSLKPGETLMVGDNPLADLHYARQAGIKNVVLVQRTQKDDWLIGDDGGIYVKSLHIVPDMLKDKE